MGLAARPAPAEDAAALAELIDHRVQSRLERWECSVSLRPMTPSSCGGCFSTCTASCRRRSRPPISSTAGADKRAQLIDELLASPRFGEHFGDLWRGRLISPLANEQRQQTERFADWLAERFNGNEGWDQMVFDLLTATGKMEENPAVTYLIEGRIPLGVTDLTDLSSRYFLGVRLNCAQCHDHPFVEWKQQDYWGMAAFFAQIQTPGRPKLVYHGRRAGRPEADAGVAAGRRHARRLSVAAADVPGRRGAGRPTPTRRTAPRWPAGSRRRRTRTSPGRW